ncbi:MAG TPA: hypothetical protein VGC80_07920, partial [Acetobacteraceae bacterium]
TSPALEPAAEAPPPDVVDLFGGRLAPGPDPRAGRAPRPPRQPRRIGLILVLALAICGAGAVWRVQQPDAARLDESPSLARLDLVPPAAAEPSTPASEPAPVTEASVSPLTAPAVQADPVDTERLRRSFDLFLDRRGMDTAQLTPAQRDELFAQYIAWRQQTGAGAGDELPSRGPPPR